MRKVRIPCNLPQKTVWVGEVAEIPSPIRTLSGLHDTSARCSDLFEKTVNLSFRPHVMRECEAWESDTLCWHARIGGKVVAWK